MTLTIKELKSLVYESCSDRRGQERNMTRVRVSPADLAALAAEAPTQPPGLEPFRRDEEKGEWTLWGNTPVVVGDDLDEECVDIVWKEPVHASQR